MKNFYLFKIGAVHPLTIVQITTIAIPATARRVVAPYDTMPEICTKPKAPSPRELSPQVTEGVSPPAGDRAKSKTPPVSFSATLLGEEGKL